MIIDMKTTNPINKISDTIQEYFKKIENVIAVYIHGSLVKNKLRNESDIDIALLLNDKPDKLSLLMYTSDLEAKLNRTVDIGILSSENLVYSKEAITNGKCIYSNDINKCKQEENRLLSMYLNFQLERREVLNAYKT